MRKISILGSTGSVGTSCLDILRSNRDQFDLEYLVAGSNIGLLIEQARDFRPKAVVIADESQYAPLQAALAPLGIDVAAGNAAVTAAAAESSDIVVAAIVGTAGLASTIAAIEKGRTVVFANKECLVSAGALMMDKVAQHAAQLLPIDSEHNAIFQLFDEKQRHAITRLILTGSGGPFRTASREAMATATPAQALRHPNWSMGAKITIDSATMMNKALELIEAHYLFAMPSEKIDIVIHPQSIIHSMVEYDDGSILAQMGTPDMRTPIAHALGWPDRIKSAAPKLDFMALQSLTFEMPDPARFPALRLARQCLAAGGGFATILNAANEIAVAGFLAGKIGFLDIAEIVERSLDQLGSASHLDQRGVGWNIDAKADETTQIRWEGCAADPLASLEQVMALDHIGRAFAQSILVGCAA